MEKFRSKDKWINLIYIIVFQSQIAKVTVQLRLQYSHSQALKFQEVFV